jgi:DNA-binding NarL/FixJ family response regulator
VQREIAARLVISPKTVGGHIERILDKLDVHSRAQAVGVAYREGLVTRGR